MHEFISEQTICLILFQTVFHPWPQRNMKTHYSDGLLAAQAYVLNFAMWVIVLPNAHCRKIYDLSGRC